MSTATNEAVRDTMFGAPVGRSVTAAQDAVQACSCTCFCLPGSGDKISASGINAFGGSQAPME